LNTPLVVQLPRRPGQKELRYAHLLSGQPQVDLSEPAPPEPAPKVDRIEALEQEVSSLRSELSALQARFEEFRREFQ
jgi:uncharacterized protein YceH (UPF0502 family)